MARVLKSFDACEVMRSIRDKVSTEIEGLTLEQEQVWLASQEISDPYLKRLRDRAVQRTLSTSSKDE